MLTPPDIATDTIIAYVRERYELSINRATFLPLGADAYAAVYRLDAVDGATYFLKLKRGEFDEAGVAVPAFLREQGLTHVMAPLHTTTGQLWTSAHEYRWILYPFLEGRNGFHAVLSDARWIALGRTLRAVHDAQLPTEIARLVQREDFTSRWRDMVTTFVERVDAGAYTEPFAARMAAIWRERRAEIRQLVQRATDLAQEARARSGPLALCHTDLHPGNILIESGGEFAIVDWDAPLLAARERDLMFFGCGGFSDAWDDPRRVSLFYEGYGPVEIDLVTLAYYRYERIVADFATYGEQVFGQQGGVEDLEKGLQAIHNQFLPGGVLDCAQQTYARLGERR